MFFLGERHRIMISSSSYLAAHILSFGLTLFLPGISNASYLVERLI